MMVEAESVHKNERKIGSRYADWPASLGSLAKASHEPLREL